MPELTASASPSALANLPAAARELAGASVSANTMRAYRGALARMDAALDGQPPDDAALAAYLAQLHLAGRAPATIGQVVAAVRFTARASGRTSPIGPASERVLAGIRREGRERGRGQVVGVRWEQADAAAAIAAQEQGGASVAGARDAAILVVMSDAMLRVSECAALDCQDVERSDDGSGRLTVRQSKTDQEGRGQILYLGAPTVARIDSWLEAAGHSSGALFRRVRRGGWPQNERLSARGIRTIVATRVAAAGIQGRVSGHSPRVGSAQSLAAAGASLVEMQTAGRWQSPAMPGRYARAEFAGRGAVARLRYGQ